MDFFIAKGHTIVPSAPIVVKNDPTLMFTNAGMNQFKDYFLGNKKAPASRVADTQKCLRVSGKHNDLEEVGVDTYHHTMFEMLGNWSFGDPARPAGGYFKKEAIAWSWELLTKVYQLDKSRIYVTIFEGDAAEGLPKDEEAYAEWKKWVAEDRILMGNRKDNFWEMGDTGPCGPCTEIHYDTRPEANNDGHQLVNHDETGMVMEIWNNVFIQFNRKKDGSLAPLPAKHVDTGMGLERLVRVLQNKQSNYDTDIFLGTLQKIASITKIKYSGSDNKTDVAFRVLADHIRAICFTIADGQLPSNTGAGYVIRRILRRAVRYYYSYLSYQKPLLFQLVPVIAKQFENVFPEVAAQLEFVSKVIKEEEEAFLRTLEKGLKRVDDLIAEGKISGKDAFELYDTYGFPFDLTKLIAAENKLSVDEKEFASEMRLQKERSRSATTIDAEDWIIEKEGNNTFVGYDVLSSETALLKYRKIKTKGKELYQLVLEETPFYAESGGQVGDRGQLIFENTTVKIFDTKKDNDLIIHFADNIPENLSGKVMAKVDADKRKNTALHHSATHLLHAALRKVLGTHVAQKGSLVNEEHLRFDFSHFAKMTDEEIQQVEMLVNKKIRENIPVVIKEMPKEEAMQLGAMALFGEKYGDNVRVVIIDPAYSIELCGGTHIGATGELGICKITNETAVAAGVRRIEAVCGTLAESYINNQLKEIALVRQFLKHPKDVTKAIENLAAENNALRQNLTALEEKQLAAIAKNLLTKTTSIGAIQWLAQKVEVDNAAALKKLCYDLKSKMNNFVIVLTAAIQQKPFVAICIDESLVQSKGLDAGKLIKEKVAPLIKGGGGGQKTLATAGGQNVEQLEKVLEVVRESIKD